jgi:hypothetical protein
MHNIYSNSSIAFVSGPEGQKQDGIPQFLEYARVHPEKRITIIGNVSHPATYTAHVPNVEVIPFVERSRMPGLYKRHKRLIRMTTEDGLPRMVHEALLCGLQVIFNGQIVEDVPKEREPTEFASTFRKALDKL